MKTTQSLATLIGSRICHDLISPVGAIQNGIELLRMEGKDGAEVALIEESAVNASAKIRFMRIAFGLAGEQSVGEAEIRSVLGDLGMSGRVQYVWAGGADCPRAALQTVFLAMLCLESAMPRGGTIRVAKDDADWVVSGPADRAKPDPVLWTFLCGGAEPASTLPAHVQFPLLVSVLQTKGQIARVDAHGETVSIRFPA